MATVKDVNVKTRLNVLSTLLKDKGDADQRPGKEGAQRKTIIDVPEVDIPPCELETRLTNAQLVLEHGYTVDTTKPPPRAVTDDATSIAATSVVLNGHIKSGTAAIAATCGFQYGTTKELGSETVAAENPVSEALDTPITLTIAGLTASTKYYYRAYATDANYATGMFGVLKSFITLAE